MPTLTRWFIRAAIVHLVLGLVLGLVMSLPAMAQHEGPWRAVYVHLLVMGWATQMIFGVALWMFPRRTPLDLQATDILGWACFGATNLGLVLRAVTEPALAMGSRGAAPWVVIAAALQLLAVLAFVVQAWPRVVAR